MANKVETFLTEDLLSLLRQETYVSISTIDHETGAPHVNAISWVYAPDNQTIRFSVDNRSRIVENVRKNNELVMTVIGNGSTYAIHGEGTIIDPEIEDMPIKLAMMECSVKKVRDIMFYGAKMTTAPGFKKTYDMEAAVKLDSQVMNAMKGASSGN